MNILSNVAEMKPLIEKQLFNVNQICWKKTYFSFCEDNGFSFLSLSDDCLLCVYVIYNLKYMHFVKKKTKGQMVHRSFTVYKSTRKH